ncbi:MAG: hypothetical protein IT385_17750 [Deltaproteobacteria bacterium]|nr:hypothetical protein [Deltaproteobacteria bacterium]
MSDDAPPSGPASAAAPIAADSPIADAALAAARDDLAKVWKRIARRAPDDVRVRVEAALARVEATLGTDAPARERIELARTLEELGGELRGRRVFVPDFYTGGRLALVRAWDPITIHGAIDHLRVERFFERYLKRAEQAFERLDYFFTRAGLLQPKDKAKKPAWEQPYAQFEQYRELIWGRTKKPASKPPGHRPIR